MSRGVKRLEPVQRLKQSRERDAARALGERQQALAAERQRLEELLRYREDYLARYQATLGRGGLAVAALQEYRVFLDRLDQAIAQQQDAIEKAARTRDQRRDQWLATRVDTRAIDKVVASRRRELAHQGRKREQAEMDEHAARKGSVKGEKI